MELATHPVAWAALFMAAMNTIYVFYILRLDVKKLRAEVYILRKALSEVESKLKEKPKAKPRAKKAK